MWRASRSGLSGLARLCAALAVLLALYGCNISVEEDVLADLPGQAPSAATFELRSYQMDGKVTPLPAAGTILRFVDMPPGRAIAELYSAEKDKPSTVASTEARLLPLGDGWFVLSMREIVRHGNTSYALVRFPDAGMLVIPTAQGKVVEFYRNLGLEYLNAGLLSPIDPLALTTAFRAAVAAYARDPLPFMALTFAKVDATAAKWDEGRETGLLKLRETITEEYGRLTREERALLKSYLEPLSASGGTAAAYLLGLAHYFDWEFDKAVQHATRAIERGMESAKVVLAMSAQRRHKPDANVDAVSLYRQAADAGDPIAMVKLAREQQDLPTRIGWLQKSVEAGSAEARTLLAGAYFLGEGVPRSLEEARKLLEAAAAQGEPAALHQLSEFLRAGHGGKKDEAAANRTLMTAAKRGSSAAQAELGQRLSRGEGFPVDTVESLIWLGSAIGRGNSTAIRHLDGIEATMNHPEILSHAALQLLFSEKMLQAAADKEIAAWCGVGMFTGEPQAVTKARADCARDVTQVHRALANTYRSDDAPGVLLECIDMEGIAMPSPQWDIFECHDEMQFQ